MQQSIFAAWLWLSKTGIKIFSVVNINKLLQLLIFQCWLKMDFSHNNLHSNLCVIKIVEYLYISDSLVPLPAETQVLGLF